MIQLLQCDEDHIHLSLEELLTLKDAQIPGGSLAMRPLDQEHVQQLVQSDQATWPDILVTRADQGYIIIDGHHRREAAHIKQAERINATCKSYSDLRAVVDAAFRSNLTHGLKASLVTRGDYAYWLHVSFPAFPQEMIAERVGLTQGAVSKAISRRVRALQQREGQDEDLDPRVQRKMALRSFQRFTKEATHFFGNSVVFSDDELATLLRSNLNEPERIELARIGRLLAEIEL